MKECIDGSELSHNFLETNTYINSSFQFKLNLTNMKSKRIVISVLYIHLREALSYKYNFASIKNIYFGTEDTPEKFLDSGYILCREMSIASRKVALEN